MSLEKICAKKYTDGIHKVKNKLTGDESYVYVGEAWLHDDDFYMVLDYKTNKVINNDYYEHIEYYEDGRYFECEKHEGVWLFDDGDEHCDGCHRCKCTADETSSFKADKYRLWSDGQEDDVKPERGLFILQNYREEFC